jgi:glutamine synthetase
MNVKLEYVWLDGFKPEPNLRSKIKIVDYDTMRNQILTGNFPLWNFDGSSTMQAETGSSDCILKPVRGYSNKTLTHIYVLCEVMNPDGTPHESNMRSKLKEEDYDMWFGFEQEYFIYDRQNKCILGHNENNLEPQGKYYCGVGNYVAGRDFVEEHMEYCLDYRIEITGINAEVAMGQWEYQVFSQTKLKAGDDLWMSRYFLHKLAEKYNYGIELHPKPIQKGEWNGSGLHTNFSTKKMRDEGGEDYFNSIFSSFHTRHHNHIQDYGSNNQMRLTGKFETQSIDKFSWGISDRGASIRVPQSTAENWKGYIEDRRPSSNADPYKIIYQICESLKNADTIHDIKYKMNYIRTSDNNGLDFKTLPNEELLKEYFDDEKYFVDSETMDGSNIPTTEIAFNPNK